MARSTDSIWAERINVALKLSQESYNVAIAAAVLVRRYGLSKRQAYRSLEIAKTRPSPVPMPDQKMAFTSNSRSG